MKNKQMPGLPAGTRTGRYSTPELCKLKLSLCLLTLFCLFTLTFCSNHANSCGEIPSLYTIDDFSVWDEWAVKEELPGYKDYEGKVIKVSPVNGANWGDTGSGDDYSRALYYSLSRYSGYYRIKVSMSILVEKPLTRMYTGPANIGWTIQNGPGYYRQFGGPAEVIPTDEWVDLEFFQTFNIAGSGDRWIFIDGLNLHQGLIDLTLYIRHLKLTLVKITGNKYIALTFDDGPFDETGLLLDKLSSLGVKASFFLNGMRIEARDPATDSLLTPVQREEKKAERRALVKRMFDSGHDIGNHSYSHNYLGGGNMAGDGIDTDELLDYIDILDDYTVTDYPLSEEDIRTELEDAQTAIQKAVYGDTDYMNHPRVAGYFRTPFSSDPRFAKNLLAVTESMGLPLIYGEGSDDYIPGTSVAEIAGNIIDLKIPWGVLINHDPPRSVNVLAALDVVVPKLRAEGYEFLTVSEMEKRRKRTQTPGTAYQDLYPDLP